MRIRVISLAVVLFVWWFASQFTSELAVPNPFLTFDKFSDLMQSGKLLGALGAGIKALFIGGGLSFIIGIPVGILMGIWRPLAQLLEHYFVALYVMPMAAVVPLMVLWFGFEFSVRVIFILIFTIPQITITCYEGAKNMPDSLVEVARAYRARKQDIFFKVIIPYEIPFIITALRLGVGRAIQGMVVAELLIGAGYTRTVPLGTMIRTYASNLDLGNILAIILFIMLLGIIATAIVRWIADAMAPWREGMVAGSGE